MDRAGYPVSIDRRVFVTMADGTRISLTVYLPDAPGDGPFPAVVESLPYRKDDDCFARDYSTYTYLAARGFAGVRIDVRGTGASTGIIRDEYLEIEQLDNLEVLDWIVDQPWSNGNVGMWGISWGGFSALQTAMLRPPQLKAILAMHATHDRFACDVHYTGGSLHAAEQVDWPPSMITTNALPPDPDIFGDGWFDEWVRRLEETPQWPIEWLRHQHRDSYWEHGSPARDYGAIECPTMLVGGWLDGYVDGILALSENLTCPTRTIVGPWGHFRPATGEPGPTLDHFDLMARWFGHHLRDDDNDVMDMPDLTIYVRTRAPYDGAVVEGHWRSEPVWPPADVNQIHFDLGSLTHDAPGWTGPQWVGSHAPAWDRSGIRSRDGQEDDSASICFDTEPLVESMEVLGTPTIEITVTTDRPYGVICARLLQVAPDGSSHLITRGSRNLAFPGELSSPVEPTPGSPLTVSFPLMATSATVPAGSRLRLAISGADFPVVWPPPGRFALTVDPEASRLVLPTVPTRGTERALDLGSAPPPLPAPVETIVDDAEWAVERSEGKSTFSRTVSSRELQPERGMLTYASEQSWEVTVEDDDPGTTRASAVSALILSRPGWEVEVTGSLEIGGADPLVVEIELSARCDGRPIWERSWKETITREWA